MIAYTILVEAFLFISNVFAVQESTRFFFREILLFVIRVLKPCHSTRTPDPGAMNVTILVKASPTIFTMNSVCLMLRNQEKEF